MFKKVPTVDGALGYFNKALTELRAAKEHQDAQAALHAQAAEQALEDYCVRVATANAAEAAANAEAQRAAKAIVKIEEFVL